jgi:hypothetical protein
MRPTVAVRAPLHPVVVVALEVGWFTDLESPSSLYCLK